MVKLINKNLNRALGLKKMNRKILASHLEVSENQLRNWAMGKDEVPAEAVQTISQFLKVKPAYLVGHQAAAELVSTVEVVEQQPVIEPAKQVEEKMSGVETTKSIEKINKNSNENPLR